MPMMTGVVYIGGGSNSESDADEDEDDDKSSAAFLAALSAALLAVARRVSASLLSAFAIRLAVAAIFVFLTGAMVKTE